MQVDALLARQPERILDFVYFLWIKWFKQLHGGCTDAFFGTTICLKCVRRLQGGEHVQVDALGARQPERIRDLGTSSFGKSGLKSCTEAARMHFFCLLYTSPSPRDGLLSRMPSSA